MLYKRGDVWWYRFKFLGQVVRESAKTPAKTVAREAERSRRRRLEEAYNGISRRERPPLFSLAASDWLKTKEAYPARTYRNYSDHVVSLTAELGDRLLCDIGPREIVALQNRRRAQGWKNRTVNHEVGTLRQILKSRGCWGPIVDQVKMLRERHDVGRAIPRDDEEKLLTAIRRSQSPSLLPLFVLSIDTGLRASEVRSLRRTDLDLTWENGVIVAGSITVPNSKTEFGTGRVVPLTRRACDALTLWLSRFDGAEPRAYVFPFHRVKAGGKGAGPIVWDVDLTRPVSEWKNAWRTARTLAGLSYRWHDLRHSFVSRLAENPHVSEETIRALAGHVSRKMLERYSHIRTHAKVAAIRSLEGEFSGPSEPVSAEEGAQKGAQSASTAPHPTH